MFTMNKDNVVYIAIDFRGGTVEKYSFLVFLFIFVFLSLPAHSEFYRYKDASGTIIFTDDLSQVPMDQRPGVDVYESATSPEGEQKDAKRPSLKRDSSNQVLEKKQKWLIKEQNVLNLERDELLSQKQEVKSQEEKAVYNKKVRALNKRIEVYKEKLNQFNEANK